jgi:hypothetical protein
MSETIERNGPGGPRDPNDPAGREGPEGRETPEINPLVTNPYAIYLSPAFAGMKGNAMEDYVETFAANGPIGFGLVVGRTAPHLLTVQVGGANPVGVSLHDHTVASRGGYLQYDAVSVMSQGAVWCQVTPADASSVDDGIYVFADPATGMVGTATGAALPKAVFRSKAIDVYDITYTTTTKIALVQLSYGLAVG